MIVKTRIVNPTDQKQRYSWIPKHGAFIAPKSEMIIDGDIYTLAEKIVKNRQCIDADMESGRVKITLITDMETMHPNDVPAPKVEEKVEVKKAEPPKPMKKVEKIPVVDNISDVPKKTKAKPKGEANVVNENILGMGLQEGSIEESKAAALNPLTGEEVETDIPEAEDVSDFLWGGDKEEEEVPELEDAPKLFTKTELKAKLKSELVEIASEMGLDDAEDIKKSLLIEWILENQK
jgi:hypothetical protein